MPALAAIQRATAAIIICLCACFAGTNSASAQGAQAGSITDQFEAKASERARSKPASPSLPKFSSGRQNADTEPLFVLTAVEVRGATVVARDAIAEVYRAYLGNPVSQTGLLKITDGITELYRQKGYALSRAFVPPQDVEDGRIQIKVVEGYVADVRIEGDEGQKFGAQETLRAVMAERPLRRATFERSLLLLSDTPGVRIKDTILKEIGDATGRFHLIVHLETWRLFASADLDNRGTPDIGPLQSFLSTALNSGLVEGDIWALNFLTIPNSPEELAYVGGVIDFPISADGVRVGLKGSYSDIRPDGKRGLVDTRIHTEELGLHASFKPFRTREASLGLTLFANIRTAEERDIFGTTYDDRIQGVSLIADFQLHDKYGGSNYLVLALRQGHGEPGSVGFKLSRPDADGEFQKANWSLVRHQRLSGAWSALVSTSGQLAASPLLQSEQFYIGGPLLGRAFAAGALGGDTGVTGQFEVRFDRKLEVRPVLGYQLYAFLDAGIVWNWGSDEYEALSSYGAGVRVSLQDGYRAGFEIALPIDYHSSTSDDDGTRFIISLSKSFRSCTGLSCSR